MNTCSRAITPDLLLKAAQPSDAEAVFSAVEANRAHLRQWLPWLDHTQAVGDTFEFLESSRLQAEKRESMLCSIWFRNRIAGMIGFHSFDYANRSTSMGYWLRADLQGNGIMTRSCQALVDYAFTDLNMNRVAIRCAVGNQKSRAIPQRLNFTQEGILREAEWLYDHFVDLVVYGMLKREWEGTAQQ